MSGKARMVRKKTQPVEDVLELSRKELIGRLIKKKPKEKFLNENQKKFHDTLLNNQITICSGVAGSGKSHITLKAAVELILDPTTLYEKIVIVRPAVEGGESRLGFLKGTLREKMEPYMYPSFYLLHKIIGEETTKKLEQLGIIEIMSISFLRGLSLDNSIVIIEESQNTTPSEMKLILTRIGSNSKFFISGDVEQSDKYKQKDKSGLYDAMVRLKDMDDIGIFEFGPEDVVRNPIISKILERYD